MRLVIQDIAILLELSKVAGGKKHLPTVQTVDIVIQMLRRKFVIIGELGVMTLFQLLDHFDDGFALIVAIFDNRKAGEGGRGEKQPTEQRYGEGAGDKSTLNVFCHQN